MFKFFKVFLTFVSLVRPTYFLNLRHFRPFYVAGSETESVSLTTKTTAGGL